jgi:AcrR family transcriptional regulator
MKMARAYQMTARAESAERTAASILSATKELFATKAVADITLADIAARAGVTVQTVLRRFGDKDSLFAAAIAHFTAEVDARRGRVKPDDPDEILAVLCAHYEDYGPMTIKLLAEELTTSAARDAVSAGRRYHRSWCETVFAGTLARVSGTQRDRRLAQLMAICDLRTWEMLRITANLSHEQVEVALREMLAPLVAKG